MKRWLDDDSELQDKDKARILVTVIPFVLIIIILIITLIVNSLKKDHVENDDLQKSIMEYADESKETYLEDNETVNSSAVATAKPTLEPKSTTSPIKKPEPTPNKGVMEADKTDYSKVKFDKEEQLKEMMTYWADNNQKALDDLANLERFIAMSWNLRNAQDFYYYGDKDGSGNPNGKGIAVYADNQYYYGEWRNGVRSGKGTWIHYHIHATTNHTDHVTYHQYTGNWANDLPDGEGSEHYDFDISLLKKNVGYNANLIGSYSEGLIHGEFYLTNIYSDEEVREWYAQANKGSWIYQNQNRDKEGRGPVQVEDRDPDNYIWLHPKDNMNIGIPCLISKNKN